MSQQQAKAPAGGKPSAGKKKKQRRDIPYALGMTLMVVTLCISLVAGNARALQKAQKDARSAWKVEAFVDGRVAEARNLLKIAGRYDVLTDAERREIEDAADALDRAKTARETAAANDALQGLMSDAAARLMAGGIKASDESLLSGVMDDFLDNGNMLRQQARRFNEAAKDAVELYERLPTKFLLPRPDYYEGA